MMCGLMEQNADEEEALTALQEQEKQPSAGHRPRLTLCFLVVFHVPYIRFLRECERGAPSESGPRRNSKRPWREWFFLL